MANNLSVPERFVLVWAQIISMPDYDSTHPHGLEISQMNAEAADIVLTALRHAARITELTKRLKETP